jgi:iron-sulfur cluster assembly protein
VTGAAGRRYTRRVLTLTPGAIEAVRGLLTSEGAPEDAGLRFSGREDAGEVEIDLEVAEAPAEGDAVVESGGARVFLDELAADMLDDQTLDIEAHGDHVHFVFAPPPPHS